jgi:DNA-binding transcriptional MerR regulator
MTMERIGLRVGEVAARAGVHRETLRRISGYRAYPAETVERVRLIKWAQGLGFTLREIVELSRIPRDHVRGRTKHVRSRAVAKIDEIDKKIRRLVSVKRELLAIAACRCNGTCPILSKAVSPERSA